MMQFDDLGTEKEKPPEVEAPMISNTRGINFWKFILVGIKFTVACERTTQSCVQIRACGGLLHAANDLRFAILLAFFSHMCDGRA